MSSPASWTIFISGCCGAVLGAIGWYARAGVRSALARAQARIEEERLLLAASARLIDASRQSGRSVLAALDETVRAIDPQIDAVCVFVPAGGDLVCVHAGGARAEYLRRIERDRPRALPAVAAARRCRAAFPHDGDALLPTDRSGLAVPMIDRGDVRAVLYLASPATGALRGADLLVRAVEGASAPYGIALERETERDEARHDALTGLLGPRAFRRLLHDEIARVAAHAPDAVVSVWFVDTDNFKGVNDTFGHRAGDRVLAAMAALLREHLTFGSDAGARNGGDEFCALIRGAGKGAAIERAQRFCEAVRAHDFALPLRITASLGVASYPQDASTSSLLLEAADAAMYHSKRNGRNRVAFAVAPGRYACAVAEAAGSPSRRHRQWRSSSGDSCAERSF